MWEVFGPNETVLIISESSLKDLMQYLNKLLRLCLSPVFKRSGYEQVKRHFPNSDGKSQAQCQPSQLARRPFTVSCLLPVHQSQHRGVPPDAASLSFQDGATEKEGFTGLIKFLSGIIFNTLQNIPIQFP